MPTGPMTPGLTRLRTSRRSCEIDATRIRCGWNGLYFGGTAFKKQRPVDPEDYAAPPVSPESTWMS